MKYANTIQEGFNAKVALSTLGLLLASTTVQAHGHDGGRHLGHAWGRHSCHHHRHPQPTPPPCAKAWDQVVHPARIEGKRHLLFNSADLAFLSDSTLLIESVELHVTLKGRYSGKSYEIPLSLNGLRASARG
ncbi:MAG TPA: hypothetical protein VL588_06760, partial [Bdellovibrionota bacterium]|nr:hypothetical protein [Bdellovibrionota bacterium]